MQKSQNLANIDSIIAAIKQLPEDMVGPLALSVVGNNANYLTGNKVNPALVELRDAINNQAKPKTLVSLLEQVRQWVEDNIRERGVGNGTKVIVEKFTVSGTEYSYCTFVPDFAAAVAILSEGANAPKALEALFADITFENDAQKVSVLYDAKVHVRRMVMQPLDSVKSGRTRERKSASETEGVAQ